MGLAHPAPQGRVTDKVGTLREGQSVGVGPLPGSPPRWGSSPSEQKGASWPVSPWPVLMVLPPSKGPVVPWCLLRQFPVYSCLELLAMESGCHPQRVPSASGSRSSKSPALGCGPAGTSRHGHLGTCHTIQGGIWPLSSPGVTRECPVSRSPRDSYQNLPVSRAVCPLGRGEGSQWLPAGCEGLRGAGGVKGTDAWGVLHELMGWSQSPEQNRPSRCPASLTLSGGAAASGGACPPAPRSSRRVAVGATLGSMLCTARSGHARLSWVQRRCLLLRCVGLWGSSQHRAITWGV